MRSRTQRPRSQRSHPRKTNFSAIDPAHLPNAVKFGAANAVSYTVNSPTQITAVPPAGSPATVNVSVTTAGGASDTASTADDYTYATPAVTSVVINGGSIVAKNKFGQTPNLANQSSVVEQILVTFNQQVKIDPGAFTVTSLAGLVTAQGIASSATGTGDNTSAFIPPR